MLALLLVGALTISAPDQTCRVRDKQGRVIRSMVRRAVFLRASGYPKGRPGYVADHTVPLCAGGCDLIGNFSWQTIGDSKLKDRWESAFCAGRTTLTWAEWHFDNKCGACPGPGAIVLSGPR